MRVMIDGVPRDDGSGDKDARSARDEELLRRFRSGVNMTKDDRTDAARAVLTYFGTPEEIESEEAASRGVSVSTLVEIGPLPGLVLRDLPERRKLAEDAAAYLKRRRLRFDTRDGRLRYIKPGAPTYLGEEIRRSYRRLRRAGLVDRPTAAATRERIAEDLTGRFWWWDIDARRDGPIHNVLRRMAQEAR